MQFLAPVFCSKKEQNTNLHSTLKLVESGLASDPLQVQERLQKLEAQSKDGNDLSLLEVVDLPRYTHIYIFVYVYLQYIYIFVHVYLQYIYIFAHLLFCGSTGKVGNYFLKSETHHLVQ